jgi:hypothetical protein
LAQRLIENLTNGIYASAASVWEVAIKYALKRGDMPIWVRAAKLYGFPDRFYLFQIKNHPVRHTRESGYPDFSAADWIPAFAGMTEPGRAKCENLLEIGIICPGRLPGTAGDLAVHGDGQ